MTFQRGIFIWTDDMARVTKFLSTVLPFLPSSGRIQLEIRISYRINPPFRVSVMCVYVKPTCLSASFETMIYLFIYL